MPQFDERDAEILRERAASLLANKINVGDFVRFADGVARRVSYIWTDEHGEIFSVQTSGGGSFYLADGFVSFSGSLYHGVPFESLTDTGDRHDGDVWFFHHDFPGAGCGVACVAKFRIWTCNTEAPQ